MINRSEEKTVKYYDIVYDEWMNEELTREELGLITGLVKSGGKVLDVGCGSGRHLVPLSRMGYEVVGIEPLAGMIELMHKKEPSIRVINDYFLDAKIDEKFDLVMVMWNAFNQLAYSETEAVEVLNKLKALVIPGGKVIIGNSSGENAYEGLDFEKSIEKDGKIYRLVWRLLSFSEQKNITECNERIVVEDTEGNVIDDVEAKVVQRWWRKEELERLGGEVGLSVDVNRLNAGDDLYYVLST